MDSKRITLKQTSYFEKLQPSVTAIVWTLYALDVPVTRRVLAATRGVKRKTIHYAVNLAREAGVVGVFYSQTRQVLVLSEETRQACKRFIDDLKENTP